MRAQLVGQDLDVIIREEVDGWKILSTDEVPLLRGELEVRGKEKPVFVHCENQGINGLRGFADVVTEPRGVSLEEAEKVIVRVAYGPALLHLAGGNPIREAFGGADGTLNIRYYRIPPQP